MINTIKKFTLILFGLIIIILTIYFRVLNIKLPKDLMLVSDGILHYNIMFIILFGFTISIVLLNFNINLMLDIKSKKNLFTKSFSKINIFMEDSLFEFYNFILQYIPNNIDKISFFGQKFYLYFKNKTEVFFLIILTIIRFFILFAFLIDVFIFFKLEYMYKALFLLIITLIVRVMFFILRDFANNALELEKTLIITQEGFDDKSQMPIMSYKFQAQYEENNDLEYFVHQYILCNKLLGYFSNHDQIAYYIQPRLNSIIYLLYVIGWSFVFYKNLMLL